MDRRTLSFTNKFQSAALLFKCRSLTDIVSLKFRGSPMSADYNELVGHLQHASGLRIDPLKGDFAGRAWAISVDSADQIILVEHETGLEILYMAGSIASLVALIPLAASGWNSLRRHFGGGFPDRMMGMVETRQLDAAGTLVEQNVHDLAAFLIEAVKVERKVNAGRIAALEKQVGDLKRQLASKGRRPTTKTAVRKKGKSKTRRASKR